MNGRLPKWAFDPSDGTILLYKLSEAVGQKKMITSDDIISIIAASGDSVASKVMICHSAYCLGYLVGREFLSEKNSDGSK